MGVFVSLCFDGTLQFCKRKVVNAINVASSQGER